MFTEKYCDKFYQNIAKLSPTYVWGANFEVATKELMDKLFKSYGSAQYPKSYYDEKWLEAQSGSGYISDCSGMFLPLSKKDNTAKGYYAECPVKGAIDTLDRKHSALIFRGSSPTAIHHIGYYCAEDGYVYEMKSSKDNFCRSKMDSSKWNYWGHPSFIMYETHNTTVVDMAAWQKNVNYKVMASSNTIDGVILKFMRKELAPDKMFSTHYKGFTEARIPVLGFYTYTYATDVNKAKSDALKGVQILDGKKGVVWFDVEDKVMMNLGSRLVDICNAAQQVYEEAGFTFGIYTGMSFYNSYFKPYLSKLKCKNWWIARYYNGYKSMAVTTAPDEKYKPLPLLYAWQYTSSGQVPGYVGNLDLSKVYSVIDYSKTQYTDTKISSKIIESTAHYLCVVTAKSSLNVREKPTTDSKIVKTIKGGSYFQSVAVTENGWFKLDTGYVSGQYARPVVGIVKDCTALNMRKESSTNSDVVTTLPVGTKLFVVSTAKNGWIEVQTSDKKFSGFCSEKYVKLT